MRKSYKFIVHCSVYFQILLILSIVFYTSFGLRNNLYEEESIKKIEIDEKRKDNILKVLKIFNKIVWSENNFVSAIDVNDLDNGVYTCPLNNNGKYCQEYPASECDSNCKEQCIPTPASRTSECKPGTCYDESEGICSIGATESQCEEFKGIWYNDPYGNIDVCRAGCCVLGDDAFFITEEQCEKESLARGLKSLFRPELNTEIQCLALSKTQEMGACVIEDELQNQCSFTSKSNCELNLRGDFYSGVLCSHPDLNTGCEKQKTTGCVEGLDEVYWFDSCGNRENIYDSNKLNSWNNGRVLSKENSCQLDNNGNSFANQATCGNCNYFSGSTCGEKTNTEKLAENSAEYVCRTLECIDENGKKREHGESWCSYQSSIGLQEGVNGNRASNSVGGRSFKQTCYEGEIITDTCADYNTEICTQSKTDIGNGETFSTAACRTNRALECYQYNKKGEKEKCNKNPDCFVKNVDIADNFKFDLCVPKYSPGFDLDNRGEGATTLCLFASQKCQVVYVKELDGWKIKSNEGCEDIQKFAEQMNDLCISLGDCGTKANYRGDVTVNHRLFKSDNGGKTGSPIGGEYFGLSDSYIQKLKTNADEKRFVDNYIEAASLEEFYGDLGIPGTVGTPVDQVIDKSAAVIQQISMVSGAMGLAMVVVPYLAAQGIIVPFLAQGAVPASGYGPIMPGLSPFGAAFSGALTGAAIGFAVVTMLISFTGVGRGLDPAVTYALAGAGAAGGAMLGLAFMGVGSNASGFAALFTASIIPIIGWIIMAIVITIVIVFALLGIGKVRNEYYTFQCLPWEAESGGDNCGKCGSDGYPCSKYACNSLGQNCDLINEESENPECVNIAPNDFSAPVIMLNESYLPEGYEVEYSNNGAKIKTDMDEGCIPESYDILLAGVDINEPSRCSVQINKDDLTNEGELLSAGLYRKTHGVPILVPPLSSFGLENFNPDAKAEVNYHIRCEDKSGNKNINSYAINFCISPGNDITPPAIINKDPYYDTVKKDTEEIDAKVYTNEPANCRWSLNDKTYSDMENEFLCNNDFIQRQVLGWECSAKLSMNSDEQTYYVRCLDKPWANESERNPNTESYELKFKRAEKDLTIDYINIDGKKFEFNVKPASLDIEVKTSGGLNGKAKCGYYWGNKLIEFYDTWEETHKHTSPSYIPGKYELKIRCEDLIGSVAEKTASFEILLDNSAPIVTRTYIDNSALYVITDEPSECYYYESSEEYCYFDFSDAKKMIGDLETHYLEVDYQTTYNIKCKDEYNHYLGICSAVIKGVEL